MTMRRTAVFFCLGLLIFAALLPCAIVVTPPLCGDAVAVNASGTRYTVEIDVVSSPLLVRITPRHLARASLRSFAA